MINISVSIVIPVYNTDKILLKKCIESIQHQTCNSWNILIIDDGSKEDIAQYCDDFAIDKRISVIHQKNAGVSSARNNGTQYAKGDYVMYIDSDDVIAPFVIEEALQTALKTQADIVFGGVCKVSSQDSFLTYANKKGNKEQKYGLDDLRKRVLGGYVKGLSDIQNIGYVGRGPWGKIVKRELALNNPFPNDFPIGEDLIWNLRLLNQCCSCVVVDSIWYGYVIYQSTAISKYYGNREFIVASWIDVIKKENALFFENNTPIEGQLLAKELYCIIHYDILSPKNKMNMFKKNKYVVDLLKKQPWILLKEKEYRQDITMAQKIFLFLCRMSLGATFVSIYLRLKDNKH